MFSIFQKYIYIAIRVVELYLILESCRRFENFPSDFIFFVTKVEEEEEVQKALEGNMNVLAHNDM